ncbi:Mg2+/Co2+ transporter [Megasphaera cerevisiae DSM 20462]|jgi:manganese transport protein|uniref:Mg2+/Co2+ transporter n=1 Tax=Megasphaera cerevisiae DSM 20462 TaxID=1122219 RepID=A0A0J6WUX8_9FIRM|nr:Nramp family divalent metal transporter [Megasphaera cerevisiae]KMO87350.1 Mg2+/Co2+ transporter [Megasphaera cerevisiae DSM 20462]MCI1749936.1 Nramp family divalent metal transporter [Megasphaera cerevisiae]OKY54853.1 Mg2+/Co2+ transporter [Megasphaera cerevisiae]SJZ39438.1 manganese transport protein [Megasphaera cerevisiae DSM 20462]
MDFKEYSQQHTTSSRAREFLRYIGPGILITVGFIDPGNWASNLAAGAEFGYLLLWMVTLSTIMLILLQHNAAHLGIVTGLCLSEAATKHLPAWLSKPVLASAMLASIATALAEILGGAIALNILFQLPLLAGSFITAGLCAFLLRTNSYHKTEKIIIGFVSIIGFSFLFELSIVPVEWGKAMAGWVTPSFPDGSMVIIMSVLGAVVMPHNLFLHSEIIQSRQWNLENESVIKRQLNFEFLDTLFSMIIGWAINSSMIIIAAAVFFTHQVEVTDLSQATELLRPLLGSGAAILFAIALLVSGISSTATCGIASGSIFSGMFGEDYNIKDYHSWHGVLISYIIALILIAFISDPFMGLVYSQMLLSVQLPITIALLVYLTSSRRVMGKFVNTLPMKVVLILIGVIVGVLNLALLWQALTT